MVKVINVEKVQKEGSKYVNWKISYLYPRIINGQEYASVKQCNVSDYVVQKLIESKQINNVGELIGKKVFIGKSVDSWLTDAEKKYSFLNADTILIFK